MSDSGNSEYLTPEAFKKNVNKQPAKSRTALNRLAMLTEMGSEQTREINTLKADFNSKVLEITGNPLNMVPPVTAPSSGEVDRLTNYAQHAVNAGASTDSVAHAMNFGHHQASQEATSSQPKKQPSRLERVIQLVFGKY